MHSISVLCVYFLVAICILAAPFLNMIYHSKFADTNVCGGASWWHFIGAEVVELDNSTEIWIWYSYVKMSQWLKPLFSGGSGVESPGFKKYTGGGSKTFFLKNAGPPPDYMHSVIHVHIFSFSWLLDDFF